MGSARSPQSRLNRYPRTVFPKRSVGGGSGAQSALNSGRRTKLQAHQTWIQAHGLFATAVGGKEFAFLCHAASLLGVLKGVPFPASRISTPRWALVSTQIRNLQSLVHAGSPRPASGPCSFQSQPVQRFPSMKHSPLGESSLGEERGNAGCSCLTFGEGNGRTLPSPRLDPPETGG